MSTPIQWSALSARERDALVGEHIFGKMEVDVIQQPKGTEGYRCDLSGCWIVKRRSDGALLGMNFDTPKEALDAYRADEHYFPHYTTCPKSTAEVIEAMRKKGFDSRFEVPSKGSCNATFVWSRPDAGGNEVEDHYCDMAATLTEAICLAALRACGLEVA